MTSLSSSSDSQPIISLVPLITKKFLKITQNYFDYTNLQLEIISLQKEKNNLQITSQEYQNKINLLENKQKEEINFLQNNLNDFKLNEKKYLEKISHLESELELIKVTQNETENALTSRIKTISINLAEEEKKKREYEIVVTDLEERNSKLRHESKFEIESLQQEVNLLNDQLSDYQRQLHSRDHNITELNTSLTNCQNEKNQFTKIIEDLTNEKILLEQKILSLSFSPSLQTNHLSDSYPELPGDETQSNLRNLLRNMQERLGKTVADLRIQSMKLLETEKTLREVQEEKEVTDRSRLRLESQIETQLHQISILEEKSELISKELKSWQNRYNDLIAQKNQLEIQIEEAALKSNYSAHFVADLQSAHKKTRHELDDRLKEYQEEIDHLKLVIENQKKENEKIQRLEKLNLELNQKLTDQQKQSEEMLKSSQDCWEEQLVTISLAFEKRGETLQELEKQNALKTSQISFLSTDLTRKEKEILELRTSLTQLRTEHQKLTRHLSRDDSKGVIISELRANLAEQEEMSKSLEEYKNSLADTKKSTETMTAELKKLRIDYAELQEKYHTLEEIHQETVDTLEELSQTAAEEIDTRDAQLEKLKNQIKEKDNSINLARKRLEELSNVYDSLLKQHSELVDERSEYLSPSSFHEFR